MNAEFLITTMIVVATPGTGVIYTLAAGVRGLVRRAECSARPD